MSRQLVIYGPTDPVLRAKFLNPGPCAIPIPRMPTAILMAHAKDGFIAVSDGQGSGASASTYDQQKLFAVKGPSLDLMYGVSEAASIIEDGTKVLQPLYEKVIKDLAEKTWQNLGSYADAVILNVVEMLRKEISQDRSLPDSYVNPDQPLKFHIQFAGYCNHLPVMTERECQLWEDKWCVTTSSPDCASTFARSTFVGSNKIKCILATLDKDEFSRFKTSGFRKLMRQDPGLSREEFAEAAVKYIQACITSHARSLDSVCNSIGGDIWKATLDKDGSFNISVIVPHQP